MVCDNARDASVNAKEWIWGLCVERWRSLRIRVMCDSEHNSSTKEKLLSALSNFSFQVMCETAQNAARQIRIVIVTTLGAKTSVPCADSGGRNDSRITMSFGIP